MRILLSRVRIGLAQPSYSYRVYVPFSELSKERQSLVSMHSDFGLGAGLLACLPDVIAPLSHLAAEPGLGRQRFGWRLDMIASRVGAILLRAAFPEMLERSVPFRLFVPIAPANATVMGDTIDLAGTFEWLASKIDTLAAEDLLFPIGGER